MIPIDPEQTIKLEFPTVHGVVYYHLRYLLDKDAQRFFDLQKSGSAINEFVGKAREQVESEIEKDAGLTEKDIEALVISRAQKLYEESGKKNEEQEEDWMNEIIDIFVCGWSAERGSKAEKILPQFPETGGCSKNIRTLDKITLTNKITENLSELIGLGTADLKN